jgi:fused signal recognition particle receptor
MFEKLKRCIGTFIEKVSTEELTAEKLNNLLMDFKIALLENDVAVVVADKICEDLKKKLSGLKVGRLEDKKRIVRDNLSNILIETLTTNSQFDFLKLVEKKKSERKPLIIVFVGINGTGKTTTIAKMAKFLMSKGNSVVLACSDTYRAGAIEQLEEHARRLGVKIIKHEYGSDAASVAFDAIAFAKSKGINTVLIDTAGRMETNRNLMEEMRKIVRVTQPDLVIFVGDALAGNDAVAQAEEFNSYVPISCSILTKMDADAKGGAAVSVTYITKKPIVFVGVGQSYEDLAPFQPEHFVSQIFEKMEV